MDCGVLEAVLLHYIATRPLPAYQAQAPIVVVSMTDNARCLFGVHARASESRTDAPSLAGGIAARMQTCQDRDGLGAGISGPKRESAAASAVVPLVRANGAKAGSRAGAGPGTAVVRAARWVPCRRVQWHHWRRWGAWRWMGGGLSPHRKHLPDWITPASELYVNNMLSILRTTAQKRPGRGGFSWSSFCK